MTNRLAYKTSPVYSGSAVFVGYLFIAYGVFTSIYYMNLFALIVAGIGIFMSFSFYGVVFNTQDYKFKKYASYFGIVTGEWEDLSKMPDVTLFSLNESFRTFSGSLSSNINTSKVHKVFLLSKDHRTKVLIKKTKDLSEAKRIIDELVAKLDLNYTKYNPKRTARTVRRR